MTILGKILLFFVLILSLVWNGLVMNAYVTRTNWANHAKAAEAKAKEAAESATYQRKLAEQVRSSGSAEIANLRAELDRLRIATDTLTKSVAEKQKALDDKTAAQMVDANDKNVLQNTIAQHQKQIDVLNESLKRQEKVANESTVAGEKASADKLKADIDRDAALRRADDLEQKLLAANENLNEIRAGGGRGSARTAPPEDFKATVKRVDGDLVEINLGINAKLQKGAVLTVFRTTPTSKYLGTLTITQVDPFGAVGQFAPPKSVLRPGADDMPKVGDSVAAGK